MILDAVIALLVFWWYERYEIYQHADNIGFGLEDPPTSDQKYIQSIVHDTYGGDFHFNYLIGSIAAVLWLRLLTMLELNAYFGLLVGIIVEMIKDLFKFFLLDLI